MMEGQGEGNDGMAWKNRHKQECRAAHDLRNETNKIEISERITERLVRVHENSTVLGQRQRRRVNCLEGNSVFLLCAQGGAHSAREHRVRGA